MAQIIKLKRILQAGVIPQVSDLVEGEIAFNVPDGKLFGLMGVAGNYQVAELNSSSGNSTTVRVTNVHSVLGEAEMLAIVGADEGDVAIWSTGETYIHNGGSAGDITDWSLMSMVAVNSVNGETGTVVLDASHIEPVVDRNYVTDAQLQILQDIEANGFDGGMLGGGGTNPPATSRNSLTIAGALNAGYNTTFLRFTENLALNGSNLDASTTKSTYVSNNGVNNLVVIWNTVTNAWNFVTTPAPLIAGSVVTLSAVESIGAVSVTDAGIDYVDTQGTITATYGA